MIMKANKQIGFIYKNNESIDKILKDGDVVFEKGFLREKTSTTLPITFGGVGKYLKDYRVYGNTYQNSTNGINEWNSFNKTETNSYKVLEDGTIQLINSTKSANGYTSIGKSLKEMCPNLNVGDTVYLYIVSTWYRKEIYSSSIGSWTNGNSKTLTQQMLDSDIILYGGYQTTSTIKIMITKNQYYDTYEPYTNGVSPNPDYPQEMVSCGDKTKNLLGFGATNNGRGTQTTYDKKTGLMTTIGTATQGYPWVNEFDVDIPSGTSLTISSNSQYQIYARLYYDNSNYEQINSTTGQTRILTHDIIKIVLLINISANTTINETYYVQIEENSIATSYEPYGYKIPVNVRSDNIFSNNIIENGYLLEEAGTINANSNYYICKEINIKPLSKYILSENQNYAVSTFTPVRVCAYDKDNNFIALLLNNRRTEVKRYVDEFVIPENTDYILIGFRNSDTNIELVENIDTNIYLDEPLRGIGEYSDYIDFENGKVVRNISEVVLNGSETWYKSTISQNIRTERFSSRSPFKHIINIGYCDTFVVKNESMSVYSDTEMFQISSSTDNTFIGILINIDRLVSNTVADFVAWLSSNPVTLDYALLNPTEEDIELPNIPAIDGNNTLNIETELTPSQVYIKYKSNE